MKKSVTIFFNCLFVLTSSLHAQQGQQVASSVTASTYFAQAQEYAVVYSGKAELPYTLNLTNHPYLGGSDYVEAPLSYADRLYESIDLRYDIYRAELITRPPQMVHSVVLDQRRVAYARLHGYTIAASRLYDWKNKPDDPYLLLVHEGDYPVVKRYAVTVDRKIVDKAVTSTFKFREQFFVCVHGTCYPAGSKGKLLKLFPDKRKELEAYIKANKLKFGKHREKTIVAIVEHYESLD